MILALVLASLLKCYCNENALIVVLSALYLSSTRYPIKLLGLLVAPLQILGEWLERFANSRFFLQLWRRLGG